MLAQEEYVEVHALRRRGWSISAIARHLGRDRKTVRAHLCGERVAGQRRPAKVDPFDEFEPYVRQRLAEECQWDWVHLGDMPWGSAVFVLVGVLSHSGKFRAWLSDCGDQAHLVEGIDSVLRRLGGTARRWRVDRMATVLVPGTDRIQASFVGSPNTTGLVSTRAHRGGRTAKA